MKKYTLLSFIIACLALGNISHAQLVGTSVFLKNAWFEIGMQGNGSFGATGSPAGYHPHSPATTLGSALGIVYDYGHDGWAVGTPPFMGDFVYPGMPFEGWEIQANGTRVQAFQSSGTGYTFSGGGTMTGAGITSYSAGSGSVMANWAGITASGQLAINTETRADSGANWVVMTVKLRNTGTTAVNNIYYLRSCDPDIDQTWPGGSFVTDNWVTYQNDSTHRVLVSSKGPLPGGYLGIAAIDSRAVAFSYNTWPLGISVDLASICSMTYSPANYTLGAHVSGDIGIGLAFNIGNLAAGDSTSFSYAYIFSGVGGIDSAFTPTGGIPSLLDSFRVIAHKRCTGPDFTIYKLHYSAGLSVKTYFGDGTSTTSSLASFSGGTTTFGRTYQSHVYACSGTYTVKHVLYSGATAIDSLIHTYNHVICNGMPIKLYYDDNTNCVKDGTDAFLLHPSSFEVDSNGVPIDTISCTSGFYYTAYGSAGDIYAFKALALPGGMVSSCPSTGIIYDTINTTTYSSPEKMIGVNCSSSSTFDLGIHLSNMSATNMQSGQILADNSHCAPTSAIVTMRFSPKYVNAPSYSHPAATSASGNLVTWNLTGLSNHMTSPLNISYRNNYNPSSGVLTVGDTVHTYFTISPIIGDADTNDNTIIIIDTVIGPHDPNEIAVKPKGCLSPGVTNLEYTIHFENMGTDTAVNVYVLDTLPSELNATSMNILAASAEMYVSKYVAGGRTIMRFDFPNINLPDSTHHGLNGGTFIYNIDLVAGLPYGTPINNRVGIYFDYNDVVMTNTATNIIGCPITLKSIATGPDKVTLYPNPATNQLTIKTEQDAYSSFTITNSMGQVLTQQSIFAAQTNVDIKSLAPGLYYVTMKGESGVKTMKFVKM